MQSVEKMVELAKLACALEDREPDAAAALLDAAALCATECGMPLQELKDRLSASYVTLHTAHENLQTHGASAALRKQ